MVGFLIGLVQFVLLIRIILSWLDIEERNEFTKKIVELADPILLPFRKVMPPLGNDIDISPIVIFIVLDILKKFFFS